MGAKTKDHKRQKAEIARFRDAGWQAIQNADFLKAEDAYKRGQVIAKEIGDQQNEAVFLNYLGLSLKEQGKIDGAKQALERCLSLCASNNLRKIEAHTRLLLAEMLQRDNEIEAAIDEYLTALAASMESQDQVGIEMSFGNLGLLYLQKGWAEQASECFCQALEVNELSSNRTVWLGSLGQAKAELGQYEEAIICYTAAYEHAHNNHNFKEQAICKGSQGNALFELGLISEAIHCYEEALVLSQEAGDTPKVSVWLGNIGNAYRRLGEMPSAMLSCKQALKVAQSLNDLHSEAAHLDSLGECYLAQGQLEQALSCYESALKISQELFDRQAERVYLSNLGRAHKQLGQLEPAFECLTLAIDLFDEQRSYIKSDDLKTSFACRGQELYRDMVQVCLSLGKRIEALEYVGRAKSRAILDLLSNSPIDVSELSNTDDDSLKRLISKESQLRNQIARLERLFWEGSSSTNGGELRGAHLELEDVRQIHSQWRETVNQLKRRHPNYASLVAVDTMSFKEITHLWSTTAKSDPLLPKNVAVVEYFWTDKYLFAASIWEGSSEPLVHLIAENNALSLLEDDLITFLEMSTTEGWQAPLSLCKRLYDGIMAPVLENLPKEIDQLILVPHGSLYRLPFGALYDGNKFVIEHYALSFVPTISLIPVLAQARKQRQKSKSKPKYLVSAISDYSATRQEGLKLGSRLRSASGLNDLNFTKEEAQTVFALGKANANQSKMLADSEVKEALPSLFGDFPIVHFAGHAIFNSEEPMASGLVLADGTIFSAASILHGNLLRTHCGKLLVLSACQTGLNVVTAGGEILGLARALMYAGMPNLVLSLWEVADRSTAALMQDFHSIWQAGKVSIAKALQQAQKNALLHERAVHSWAPFIHMGID